MSLSLKVRSDCIQQAKLALQRNGFPSQRAFAEELGLAKTRCLLPMVVEI